MTKNPQTKNKNVLNINPTSAETVVSAKLGIEMLIKNINAVKNLSFFMLK